MKIAIYARVSTLNGQNPETQLLVAKEEQDEQGRWMRFETELAKRVAEATDRHNAELHQVHDEMSEPAAAQKLADEQKAAAVAKVKAELERR